MQSTTLRYDFVAKPWKYEGPNGWVFVVVPESISKEIRAYLKNEEEGWGRLKATAKIGDSTWKTAIWFDTKKRAYLLPLKAAIRHRQNILLDKEVEVSIWV